MNIDGIDPSQIEGLKTPFLESQPTEPVQAQKKEEVKSETEKIQQLAQRAQDLPDNRPEVVARGKELLNDPNYPSPDVEDKVAKILLGVEEEIY
jgi:hypothetical protein